MRNRTIQLVGTAVANAVGLDFASLRLIGICVLGVVLQVVFGVASVAQTVQVGSRQQPALMDREKEVALALSACPKSVASKAAVYVLEKSGYAKVRDAQNGFTAIVQHSLPHKPGAPMHGCGGHAHISPTHTESSRVAC